MSAILEPLFGDLWKKQRNSILVGIFVAVIISLGIVATIASLLNWEYSDGMTMTRLLNRILSTWSNPLSIVFVASVCVFGFWTYSAEQGYFSLVRSVIRVTGKDLFANAIVADRDLMLLKNFGIATMAYLWGWRGLLLVLVTFFSAVLYLPAMFVGIIGYCLIAIFGRTIIANFIVSIPQLQYISLLLTAMSQAWSSLGRLEPYPSLMIIILLATVILLASYSDVVRCREQRQLRGSPLDVMKRSMGSLTGNLNLPGNIGRLVYLTCSALFTDRRNLSMNIPVISEAKLFETFQERLSENGTRKCLTMRMPIGNEMARQMMAMPEDMKAEMLESIERSAIASRSLKFFAKIFMKRPFSRLMPGEKRLSKMSKWAERRMEKTQVKQVLICSVAEVDNVSAYAVVELPPPTQRTRIIRLLWCSDYTLKESIVNVVEYR
jgi:hypothetical protein